MSAVHERDPRDEQLIIPFRRTTDPAEPTAATLTLREFYQLETLPESAGVEDATLRLDRQALAYWERDTLNRPIGEVDRSDVQLLLANMRARGCFQPRGKPLADATINRVWRHIAKIFSHAVELRYIDRLPTIGRRMRTKLIQERPKAQRETLTPAELERLWKACAAATYPERGMFPAPKNWRVALLLFTVFGARTEDILGLTWDEVRFVDELVKFEALKTRKIQGLPMPKLVAEHLRSIKPFAASKSSRVFPGFTTRGHWIAKSQEWKPGFYATWRSEITPAAGLRGLTFKHFRESAVTRYNRMEAGLGNWIAGHFIPGVSAQFYDLPTQSMRDRIAEFAESLPSCFREVHDLPRDADRTPAAAS